MPETNLEFETGSRNHQNSTDLLSGVWKVILIQFLNYLKFSQMVPMIILYAGLIGFLVMLFFMFIYIPLFNPSSTSLPANIGPAFEIKIGNSQIIKICGWLSLVVYLIGTLIDRKINLNINWTLGKKLKILFMCLTSGYLLLFLLFILASKIRLFEQALGWEFYFAMVVLYLFTLLATGYGLLVSRIINLIQEMIKNAQN